MRTRYALVLLLAACSKSEAPPTAVPASAPLQTDEVPAANPDYVVDEPLPPFDEGPRPKLVARSALSGGGRMSLYEAADGSRLLRFDDLQVEPLAELEVVLTASDAPTAADFAGAVRVGALKGTRGNQNYLVSREVRLQALRSVAVISRAQGRVVAQAPLTPPQ